MALFAGKLNTRIEELEAENAALREQLTFKAEEIGLLAKRYVEEQDEKAKQYAEAEQVILRINQESRLRKEAEWDQERARYDAEIASLKGQLLQANLDGRKWNRLVHGWTWHNDGKVELNGVTYRRMSARKDNPLADFAIPVEEGQEWP